MLLTEGWPKTSSHGAREVLRTKEGTVACGAGRKDVKNGAENAVIQPTFGPIEED